MTGTDPQELVLDACLIITFGNAGALDVLTELGKFDVLVGSRAAKEVTQPPASDALERALKRRSLAVAEINLSIEEEAEALARFDAMPAFRGRGDAEVLALGVTRGYAVGTDERAIQRIVRSELTSRHLVSTLDVLVLAVREGRMSATEARQLLGQLDVGPAYMRKLEAAGLELDALV